MREEIPVWRGLDEWRAESASMGFLGRRLLITGNQIGVRPHPYRLSYDLVTVDNYLTDELRLRCWGAGWDRELVLRRDPSRGWRAYSEDRGEAAPAWREPAPGDLDDALDPDLRFSPIFNSLPVLRHHMHGGGEARDMVMAWISVPDLNVRRSEQRYEPLGEGRVRYSSGGFEAVIHFDEQGLVTLYEGFLERVR